MASAQGNLDLSFVHQAAIPGIWHQVLLDTWPCNHAVLGFVEPAAENRIWLQGSGPEGLSGVIPLLRENEVQFAGFRVTAVTESRRYPRFVLLHWVGAECPKIRRLRVAEELSFMRGYFIDAVCVPLLASDLPQYGDRRVFVERKVKAELWRVDALLQEASFDFDNEGAVAEITHYDQVCDLQPPDAISHEEFSVAVQAMQEASEATLPATPQILASVAPQPPQVPEREHSLPPLTRANYVPDAVANASEMETINSIRFLEREHSQRRLEKTENEQEESRKRLQRRLEEKKSKLVR